MVNGELSIVNWELFFAAVWGAGGQRFARSDAFASTWKEKYYIKVGATAR